MNKLKTNINITIRLDPDSYCLVYYKGKYWYYRKNDTHISLQSLKDSSAGINVPEHESHKARICVDIKQYEGVKYAQEQGVAWMCNLKFPEIIK